MKRKEEYDEDVSILDSAVCSLALLGLMMMEKATSKISYWKLFNVGSCS